MNISGKRLSALLVMLALASVFAISSIAWAAEEDGALDSAPDRLAGGVIATAADTTSAAAAEKPAAQAYTKAHKKLNVKKAEPVKKLILKHSRDFNGTLSDGECMKLIGIARNTYYKYKAQLRE